jgi:hypothetical protein
MWYPKPNLNYFYSYSFLNKNFIELFENWIREFYVSGININLVLAILKAELPIAIYACVFHSTLRF